jgi:heme/copper-type cytochrome/quinol oxidase subunit 2
MLNPEEKRFVEYWSNNRHRRKKILNQLSLGLPLGSLLVIAIFVNFFSSWNKRAEMVKTGATRANDSSLLWILLVAAILIVVFIIIFSVRHKWDINEQRYRELLAREGNG